jgi:hypothetical protein
MKRRKKAGVGSQNLEIGEEILIPVAGSLRQRQLGAAEYLAVLAYPAEDEWCKRSEFMDAVNVWLLKKVIQPSWPRGRLPDKYRGYRPSKAKAVMDRGFWRIRSRRVKAAIMGYARLMDGWRMAPMEIAGRRFFLRAPTSVKKDVARWKANLPCGVNKAAKWIAGPDRKVNKASSCPDSIRNIKQRIWRESLHILHLAMALPDGRTMQDLILNPTWVATSLPQAEGFLWLLFAVLGLSRREPIRLLPSPQYIPNH